MARCFQCMREYDSQYDICPFCGSERDTKQRELYFLPAGILVAGRYEIGAAVGSGGFGITYKAWDHTLSKIVAVKEYFPVGLVNRVPGEKNMIIYSGNRAKECANGKIRFLEEARNMAKFNTHPNIINVYDFFEENNTAYIVMEFLDGINYKQYIRQQGGRVPPEKALEVTRALLTALSEVHKSGILHRDISPDNLFICSDGHIKLIDFGAARFSDVDEAVTRSVILKPGYAPPEQYQTKSKQGPWTDIYAAGAALYAAVTGNVPEESVNRVEEDLLVPPEKFCPELPHNLNNAILRAMALQPELRFRNVEEFMDALAGEAVVRDVGKELRKRKIRRLISIAAVCVIALAGTFVCLHIVNQRKAAAAILEPADIDIWISASSEETMGEEKKLLEAALEEFHGEYPQITIEIQCIPEPVYEETLREAMRQGTLPALFESNCLSVSDYESLNDVSDVFDFIEEGEYFFFDRYPYFFPHKKQIPLGFCMPAVYYHTIVDAERKEAGQLAEENNFLVTKEGFFTWYNLYSGKEPLRGFDMQSAVQEGSGAHVSDKEEFLLNQKACLIADTSIYSWIQDNMPGMYEIGFFREEGMAGSFQDCFSISSSASAAEKAAAVQVLVYLLADTAQDIRYVQNGDYLPLNRSVYSAYVEINREFEAMDTEFEQVIMPGENQALLDRWRREDK